MDWSDLESYAFGDSSAQADELAGLVVAGIKTATCWDASDGLSVSDKIGERMVILDGSGVAVAVVETIELFQRRFDEVDEAFAYDEGEGDRSLAYWRQEHRRFFEGQGQFSEDMLLNCERFRVVETLTETAQV